MELTATPPTITMTTPLTHRRDLEGVVCPSVVNVVAETGDKECQHLKVTQDRETIAIHEERVTEVSHREGVRPVVVGRVTVSLLDHQDKPV